MTLPDIVRLSGCSRSTVNRYLRFRFPRHEERAWWRFSETEGSQIVAELRNLYRECATQPLRSLGPISSRKYNGKR